MVNIDEITPSKATVKCKDVFIYGTNMSGKTTIAESLDAPLILSFDSKASQTSVHAVDVNSYAELIDIIKQLRTSTKYKTVVIDLVEDMVTLIENQVCLLNKVKTIDEVGAYGKGIGETKKQLMKVMDAFAKLSANVVYISLARPYKVKSGQEFIEKVKPNLGDSYGNIVKSKVDAIIKTASMGVKFTKVCEQARHLDEESLKLIANTGLQKLISETTGWLK